jgi:YidC/Oxa1 family membrane protein insertase
MFNTLFVQPLFNILFLFYAFLPGHDFGVAVILLTIFVRLLLWPLVNRQLHSQKAMQALAPEITKVRAKAKGDRQLETQMLMELYKEKGTSPFAPIIPLLVQLPIFFALYIVFRDAVHPEKIAELSYNFVQSFPQVAHVIANHGSFSPTLFGLIDLTKPSLFLAVTAGAAQYYQTKMMQSKTPPEGDQAKMMSKIVLVFPVLTVVVGLTLPSALALYWTITSLMASLQQHLVLNRDAHEMEEAADIAEVMVASGSGGEAVAIGSGAGSGGGTSKPKAKKKSKTKKRKGSK